MSKPWGRFSSNYVCFSKISNFNKIGLQAIKFIYSEKATNIWQNLSLGFDIAKPNLCGLLRIYDLSIPFFLLLQILSYSTPHCMGHLFLVPMNFSLILATFLLEALEASRCYFFENWLMKLKCPLLVKPLGTIVQKILISTYITLRVI